MVSGFLFFFFSFTIVVSLFFFPPCCSPLHRAAEASSSHLSSVICNFYIYFVLFCFVLFLLSLPFFLITIIIFLLSIPLSTSALILIQHFCLYSVLFSSSPFSFSFFFCLPIEFKRAFDIVCTVQAAQHIHIHANKHKNPVFFFSGYFFFYFLPTLSC